MLDMSRTRNEKTREVPILSTSAFTQEGSVVQGAYESNILKGLPSNATTGSLFLGFSWGQRFAPPTSLTYAEVLTTNSSGVATLSYTALSYTDMLVVLGGAYGGTDLAYAASAPSASQFTINGGLTQITLNSANFGAQILVIYRYAPTVAQSMFSFGDALPGQAITAAIGQIGMVTGGIVYTDQFDASIDWSTIIDEASGHALVGGANGRVSANTLSSGLPQNGCALWKTAYVIEAPTPGSPWLGLYLAH